MEELAAWLVYLVGSLGYLVIDGFSMMNYDPGDTIEQALFTAFASLFVINAGQYLRLWYRWGSRRPNLELWAELVNVLGSILYLVSAFLFFLYPIDTATLTSRAHATVQSGLNFAGVLLFLLSAAMYNSCFALRRMKQQRRKKSDDGEAEDDEEESLFRSVEFYSELFNTVPSAGYLATGLIQFFSLLVLAGKGDANPDAELDQLLRTMRSLNVLFDLLYVVDAALCGLLWRRERAAAVAVPEGGGKHIEEEEEGDDFRDMRRMMWGVSSVDVRSLSAESPARAPV